MSGDAPDALARLLDGYRRAAESMRGLPMYNAALAVEGVGFREHDGRLVGAIVTPWFMNLAVLPAADDRETWCAGSTTRVAFPSGLYEFTIGAVDDDGLLATCSLFPLMHEFADHATACAAAAAAVDALFEPAAPPAPAAPRPAPSMSRRRFLRGG